MSEDIQPTISKGVTRTPTKWRVTHPAGHIYTLVNLDALTQRFGLSKKQLEKLGWKFKPFYR